MKIKTGQFCALSKSTDWKNWLDHIAPDLFELLTETLKKSRGCRSSHEVMMNIYHELYKRNFGSEFEKFVTNRYPYIIDNTKKDLRKRAATQPRRYLNKHKVFKSFRPGILSFPQKKILTGEDLEKKVEEFISNKQGVDYIIVDGHAYIEYFMPKYAHVIKDIPEESRDIYQYRSKL